MGIYTQRFINIFQLGFQVTMACTRFVYTCIQNGHIESVNPAWSEGPVQSRFALYVRLGLRVNMVTITLAQLHILHTTAHLMYLFILWYATRDFHVTKYS